MRPVADEGQRAAAPTGKFRQALTVAVWLCAVPGPWFYVWISWEVGMSLLLLVVSLAVVGRGNRLLWLASFPLVCCAPAAVFYGIVTLLPESLTIARLLVTFVGVTAVPGAVLWAAASLKRFRPPAPPQGPSPSPIA